MRRISSIVAVLLCASLPSLARAGGFEVPDNGTEALGRGTAFAAKASDGTALEYNVAGLANQRGTRVLFDGKIDIDNESFSRAGAYPGTPPQTPWGNTFYPTVSNQGVPFFAPFVALSTDFGYFDRLTFAVGAFGPSGAGNPVYPYGLSNGEPSPARYDILASESTMILPTAAVAYRLADRIDVGAAFHYVMASFNLSNTAYVDIGCAERRVLPVRRHQRSVATVGLTATGSAGVMLHPDSWLDLGVNVRGPMTINGQGTISVTTYSGTQSSGAATLQTSPPVERPRGGAREVQQRGLRAGGYRD